MMNGMMNPNMDPRMMMQVQAQQQQQPPLPGGSPQGWSDLVGRAYDQTIAAPPQPMAPQQPMYDPFRDPRLGNQFTGLFVDTPQGYRKVWVGDRYVFSRAQ